MKFISLFNIEYMTPELGREVIVMREDGGGECYTYDNLIFLELGGEVDFFFTSRVVGSDSEWTLEKTGFWNDDDSTTYWGYKYNNATHTRLRRGK